MSKKNNLHQRVELIWPATGETAHPLRADADKWIKQGWKPVTTTVKEPDNGNEE